MAPILFSRRTADQSCCTIKIFGMVRMSKLHQWYRLFWGTLWVVYRIHNIASLDLTNIVFFKSLLVSHLILILSLTTMFIILLRYFDSASLGHIKFISWSAIEKNNNYSKTSQAEGWKNGEMFIFKT